MHRFALPEAVVAYRRCARTLIIGLLAFNGCNLLRPDRNGGKDYAELKRSVESYQDADGNWIRPEGSRAEKHRGSALHSFTQYIPGLAEKPPEPDLAKAKFKEADQIFEEAKNAKGDERQRLFRAAAAKYRDAGKRWKSSYLEHDALMMAGECLFFAEDYPKAEQQYARVLKEYPRSKYLDLIDSRRMEIAMYWLQLKETSSNVLTPINLTDNKQPWSDTGGHGKRTLENIRVGNPTGKLSDDVTMELANSAFKQGDYYSAADHYADLRMTYPESPHQFEAHFLGLKAVMETYEGAEYNEGPLDEAEKILKQLNRQFPQQAKEHEEYLKRAYAEIRYRKAERLWSRAEWRILRGENNSAKLFIDRILAEYADTPFADKAKAAQEKLGELPGEPKQQFQFLADLFADRDPVKEHIHYDANPPSESWIQNPFGMALKSKKGSASAPSIANAPNDNSMKR